MQHILVFQASVVWISIAFIAIVSALSVETAQIPQEIKWLLSFTNWTLLVYVCSSRKLTMHHSLSNNVIGVITSKKVNNKRASGAKWIVFTQSALE